MLPPDAVLGCFDVGSARTIVAWGGTAGRTWRVVAERGVYLLRMRGARTSTATRLAFDHGLRAHLVRLGVPTVEPLATRGGPRWYEHAGRVYELYPFVEGRPFDRASSGDLEAAAETLARFHLAAVSYGAAQRWCERLGQFAALGHVDAPSDQLDDPALLAIHLEAMASVARGRAQRELVQRCSERVRGLGEAYAGEAYRRVARWVIHGDYTPANLTYGADGRVAGVFDLDWSMLGARCRDVADGLYFFGSWRDGGQASIWSLTEARAWDLAGAQRFLRAYEAVSPLSAEERRALPAAFAARWVAVRLEGMAKVAVEERWRFFSREIERPLEWLDAHADELLAGAL